MTLNEIALLFRFGGSCSVLEWRKMPRAVLLRVSGGCSIVRLWCDVDVAVVSLKWELFDRRSAGYA